MRRHHHDSCPRKRRVLSVRTHQLKVTHVFHCLQSKGDPSETKWWNDSGVEQNAKLECNESGGAFETCAWLLLGEVTYPEAVVVDNV